MRAPSLETLLSTGKKLAPDATGLLIQDHRQVEGWFEQFKTVAKARKPAVAAKICAALTVHTIIEEEIFYPAVEQELGDEGLVDHAVEEHAQAKKMVAEVQSKLSAGKLPDTAMKKLEQLVMKHVEEEEADMLPRMRQSEADLYELGCRLAVRRSALLMEIRRSSTPGPGAD